MESLPLAEMENSLARLYQTQHQALLNSSVPGRRIGRCCGAWWATKAGLGTKSPLLPMCHSPKRVHRINQRHSWSHSRRQQRHVGGCMLSDWCASPAGVRSSISTANRADLPGLQTSSRSSCVVHTLVQQQQCFWSVELGENSQPFVMIQQVCDTCRSGGPAHCWTSKRCSKMYPVPPLDMPLFSSLSLALPLQPFPHSLSLLNPSLYPGCAVACLPDYCNWGARPDNSWGFPSSQNHPPGWNSPTGWNSGFHLSFSSYPLSSPDYCHLSATMAAGKPGRPACQQCADPGHFQEHSPVMKAATDVYTGMWWTTNWYLSGCPGTKA